MDPYTPTWLAQHPVPVAIGLVQLGLLVVALGRRRWREAAALAVSVAGLGAWLGPSLWALAWRLPLPDSGLGPVALALPFLAVAAVALSRMSPPNPLKLRSMLGFSLFSGGLAAWVLAMALVVSGQLQARRSTALAAGIVSWAATDVVHAHRFALRSAVPLGETQSLWTVGALEAGLAATAWVAVGAWMLGEPSASQGLSIVDAGRTGS